MLVAGHLFVGGPFVQNGPDPRNNIYNPLDPTRPDPTKYVAKVKTSWGGEN